MDIEVISLDGIDAGARAIVGAKAATLGELGRIEGVRVPAGFCVTTAAFERAAAGIDRAIDGALSGRELAARCEHLRAQIERATIPSSVSAAIQTALAALGDGPLAVRSSATAEDLDHASFAGLYDSVLSVDRARVEAAIRRCWASLFTERAAAYRRERGVDAGALAIAVIVQRMVDARASGVCFTAEPTTGHRKIIAVDACFGLGEAIASGKVVPDHFTVRDGVVLSERIADKALAVRPDPAGETRVVACAADERSQRSIDAAALRELERCARRIEAARGAPQDIEWCVDHEGALFIVQSRAITTLFPAPAAPSEDGERVFVSVGHQQMMTDAMRPLGLSIFQMTAGRPMFAAAGRLFVDVTAQLRSPVARPALLAGFLRADPLTGEALRGWVRRELGEDAAREGDARRTAVPEPVDPRTIDALIERSERAQAELERALPTLTGASLVEHIARDLARLRDELAAPESMRVIRAAMDGAAALNERALAWLGQRSVADAIAQHAPRNPTSEMGLALLDLADALRPHRAVIDAIERAPDERWLDAIERVAEGGAQARAAFDAFLQRYGARCTGEIDLCRPRWSEAPATLRAIVLGHLAQHAPGERARRIERGRARSLEAERALLEPLARRPDGAQKIEEARRCIEAIRGCSGYREQPKFAIVRRYAAYKRALRAEGARMAAAGAIERADDLDFLSFDELSSAAKGGSVDRAQIAARRAQFERDDRVRPPRVITANGEVLRARYDRAALGPDVLPGLAVSAGVVEGRARVLHALHEAVIEPGDVLVTTFTDPSWTPLFVSIAALVTEVGGLMTHGAVIAREYGLPAVVGVERATELIADGDRVRVHGGEGWVELLGRAGREGD